MDSSSSSSTPVYVPRWTPSPTQTKSLLKEPVTRAGFHDDLEMQSVASEEEDSTMTKQMFPFSIAHFTPGPHHLETCEASISSSSSSLRSGSQVTKSFGENRTITLQVLCQIEKGFSWHGRICGLQCLMGKKDDAQYFRGSLGMLNLERCWLSWVSLAVASLLSWILWQVINNYWPTFQNHLIYFEEKKEEETSLHYFPISVQLWQRNSGATPN